MKSNALEIYETMMAKDYATQWLGAELIFIEEGKCELLMTVKKEMLNGFSIAHGGITYSLADSCLAFASNSHGRQSLSVETSISHTCPLYEGDVITALAEEISLTHKIGIYHIKIINQKEQSVAFFKGTVYRTSKDWDLNKEN